MENEVLLIKEKVKEIIPLLYGMTICQIKDVLKRIENEIQNIPIGSNQ
jgi:hypothetical protein